MKYDHSKGRGVVDTTYTRRKIFINKDAPYKSVLELIKEATYSTTDEDGRHFWLQLQFAGDI